jgi:hypothetical protein
LSILGNKFAKKARYRLAGKTTSILATKAFAVEDIMSGELNRYFPSLMALNIFDGFSSKNGKYPQSKTNVITPIDLNG